MKLFILTGLGVGTSLVALAACGSSSSGHGTFSGDGGGTEGSVGDAAGGGDGEGGGIFSKAYFGTVTAGELPTGTKTTYTITADFIASLDAGGTGGDGGIPCAGTQSGSCCYVPPGALADAGASDAGVTLTTASAGAILVKDGTTSIANISPGTNNIYSITSTNNPSVTWKPGDTLAVSAAGATVEAFSGNITTATELTGVTPALSYTTPATVPIASNLAVSWTAGNGINVRVLLAAAKGTAADGSITCVVPDSAGTVSVPSALLGKFATGDTGLISLTRTSSNQVSGANATVLMAATTSVGGTAKFQ